jgi:hypothetical protein
LTAKLENEAEELVIIRASRQDNRLTEIRFATAELFNVIDLIRELDR